ncbi:MAG: NTP transferase domain-containing protein, partial [Rhodomicrobium sp.]
MGRPTRIGPDMETADSGAINTAMVLAAGFGSRMRPLTDRVPKPLLRLAGRALIDHALDRLAEAGVERAVVNVHHFAGQVEAHLRGRTAPQITISDERADILETGGGVLNALPHLGRRPF